MKHAAGRRLCSKSKEHKCATHANAQVVAVSPSERRMYYHSFCAAAGKWTVGLATSRDGISWRKQGPVFSGGPDGSAFDGRGAAACHVVRDAGSRKWVTLYH